MGGKKHDRFILLFKAAHFFYLKTRLEEICKNNLVFKMKGLFTKAYETSLVSTTYSIPPMFFIYSCDLEMFYRMTNLFVDPESRVFLFIFYSTLLRCGCFKVLNKYTWMCLLIYLHFCMHFLQYRQRTTTTQTGRKKSPKHPPAVSTLITPLNLDPRDQRVAA